MAVTENFLLEWDKTGERELEAGVSHVVLYPMGAEDYDDGVAWTGITAITENPGGADVTDLYADNIKYASMRAAETFGCTIEAYTYPDEWNECDGSAEAATGVFLGQQPRKAFGLAYLTQIGDDKNPGMDKGRKLHLVYNSTASPSSRGYTTINENPDAITFSWEATSTPVNCTGHKPVSTIIIDETKCDATKFGNLLQVLFGTPADAQAQTSAVKAKLPSPDEVLDMFD